MNDFAWALQELKQQHRVRRWIWRGQCLKLVGMHLQILFDADKTGIQWMPMHDDILAQDWVHELAPGEGVQEVLALNWG